MANLLTVAGLEKSFAAPVLQNFDFSLERGEVHALVGGNGAGKSTFANILAGLVHAERGQVLMDGRPHVPRNRRHAQQLGVTLMLQELHLIPTLSVAENLFLHRLPSKWGFVSRRELRQQASEALARVNLESVDPFALAGTLGIGRQQLVVLAGALAEDCRVVILDEPTAALTGQETSVLFSHLRRLRAEGKGIIYISHRMEELREIADRVTVLRDGRRIATMPMQETSTSQLVTMMAGRELAAAAAATSHRQERIALRITGLCAGASVRNINFHVHEREIFGLSGLVGAGRTETLRAIFGADAKQAGTVELGRPLRPLQLASPRAAVRAGLGLVPEDRKQEGLLLPEGMRVNTTLASLTGWFLRAGEEGHRTKPLRDRLDVRCQTLDQPTQTLSGGNQQKIVIARWLLRDVEVLLLDEPTRGIDAAAKETIYQLLRELAAAGKSLVIVSSEVEELMALCDRIAVMSAGRIVREFAKGEWTAENLMEAAFKGHVSKAEGLPS
jgi:ribose transport system ATP-binding protein